MFESNRLGAGAMASSLRKPRRICCFICGNLNENGKKVSLFSVPKNRLDEWRHATGNNELKSTSRLCGAHFSSHAIIKGKTIGGTFFPYEKRTELQIGALPTLFLGKYILIFKFYSLPN